MKTTLMIALLLAAPGAAAADALPATLRGTGLFVEGSLRVQPDVLAFSPQYPLWSDGASKRRWIRLPPGASIDASAPDAWEFPAGTRLWKEFGYGKPVETRYIERLADGSWRFAVYVWNDAGTDAVLAPERGIPRHVSTVAPGGRYDIPAQDDCRACHEGGRVPVLGFSALQLSPARDPLARRAGPAEVDLRGLAAMGVLRNAPAALLSQPPRIPATTPIARAALGYLHGNCGHCHNDSEAAPPVGLRLHQTGSPASLAASLDSMTRGASRYAPPGASVAPAAVVVPGDTAGGVLLARMRSRAPADQMPPIGTHLPDPEGLALVERWINSLAPNQEHLP